jgi:hypothetical protein
MSSSSHKTSKNERQTTFVLVAISILLLVLIYRKSEKKTEVKTEVKKVERFEQTSTGERSLYTSVQSTTPPKSEHYRQVDPSAPPKGSKGSEYYRQADPSVAPPRGSKGNTEYYRRRGPEHYGVDPKVLQSYIRSPPSFSL